MIGESRIDLASTLNEWREDLEVCHVSATIDDAGTLTVVWSAEGRTANELAGSLEGHQFDKLGQPGTSRLLGQVARVVALSGHPARSVVSGWPEDAVSTLVEFVPRSGAPTLLRVTRRVHEHASTSRPLPEVESLQGRWPPGELADGRAVFAVTAGVRLEQADAGWTRLVSGERAVSLDGTSPGELFPLVPDLTALTTTAVAVDAPVLLQGVPHPTSHGVSREIDLTWLPAVDHAVMLVSVRLPLGHNPPDLTLASAFDAAPEPIALCRYRADGDADTLYVNSRFGALLGESPARLAYQPLSRYFAAADHPVLREAVLEMAARGEAHVHARVGEHPGTWDAAVSMAAVRSLPMTAVVSVLPSGAAAPWKGPVAPMFDELTGLPSRGLLMDRLRRALGRSQRSGESIAVAFVDVDDFKAMNDRHGHQEGDALLRQVAARLGHPSRTTDTVARIGGDEFVVLLEGLGAEAEALSLGIRLAERLRRPYVVAGSPVVVPASVGVTVTGHGHCDPEHLIREADMAMYEAKSRGGARCVLFNESKHARAARRVRLGRDIKHAFRQGEFRLVYRPIVSPRDDRALGIQAVLRWRHPQLGSVLPHDIVTAARSAGLLDPLTAWTIGQCWRDFRSLGAGSDKSVFLAVGVSLPQVLSAGFAGTVGRALDDATRPVESLCVEIPAGDWGDVVHHAQGDLSALEQRGLRFALTEFGPAPVAPADLFVRGLQYLKVNAQVTSELVVPRRRSVASAAVSLAHAAGLQVVADGVRAAEQKQLLRDCGIDAMQGALYGRHVGVPGLSRMLSLGSGQSRSV